MNRLLIILSVVILVLSIFTFFNSSNEEIKNPLNQTSHLTYQNKNIDDNLYTKDDNNLKKSTKKYPTNAISNYNFSKNYEDREINENNIKEDKVSNKFNKKEKYQKEIILDKKSFKNFIDKNNLQIVRNINGVEIYAKNNFKNDFAPPMPPVLIRVKFQKDTKIVPLQSNIVNSNQKIYIANKNDNKIEVKEIKTEDISSFMPPSIGQN